MHVRPHLTRQSFLNVENAVESLQSLDGRSEGISLVSRNPRPTHSVPCDFTDYTTTRSHEGSRLVPDIEVNCVPRPLWVNPDAYGNSDVGKS